MRKYVDRDESIQTKKAEFDFPTMYQHAHDEMTLQQSKRDQMITVYLALITFIVPFSFSLEAITGVVQGLLFLALAIIGVLFNVIVIRYRIYKESYWLACQTLTLLTNYPTEAMDKTLVQSLYYQSMKKKYNGFIDHDAKKVKMFKLFKKSLFSAETLYFAVHAFAVAVLSALSAIFLIGSSLVGIISSIAIGVVVLSFLFILHFNTLSHVFETLKYYESEQDKAERIEKENPKQTKTRLKKQAKLDKKYANESDKEKKDRIDKENADADKAFNYAFSKAWFLHFYLD